MPLAVQDQTLQPYPPPPGHRAEPWLVRLSRRPPLHYTVWALVLAALVLVPGLVFYQREGQSLQDSANPMLRRLLTAGLVMPYTLVMVRLLYDATAHMLRRLRPGLLIEEAEYRRLTHTLLTVDRRVERLLPALGLLTGVGALVYQYTINVGFRDGLQRFPATHLVIIPSEIAMTILVALFVYMGAERGLALYWLFQRPLAINAFDHSALAPLNRLSLRVTLALVGLVALPLLVWGGFRPSETVPLLIFVAATLSAVVAFLLPLWGAHRQMVAVRERALTANSAKLHALYVELHERVDRKVDGRDVADEVNALVQYQRLLEAAPTWPYQMVRIVLQVSAPIALPLLIYILQELVSPLITRASP